MTREQLDAIRARVDGATRGPWEAVTPKRYAAVRSDADGCYVYTQGKIPADTHPDTVARQQRDAQFIAAAREDVPALLAEVERLTAERDLARLNRDLEAKAFREERTSHGTTRSRVQDAISVLWHRGRIELRLDDATTTTALADALTGLFNEVERLTAEYGRVVETNRQVATHVDRIRAERDAARAEVEMLRGVGCMEDGDGPCGACRKCAFRRGVATMREAAVNAVSFHSYADEIIRALPDPEDKP